MSDILRTIIAMSVSGTLLMFLIFLVNAIGRNQLSRRFQYMIWLLLIVRLLVPVGFSTDLSGRILHLLNPQDITNDNYIQDSDGQKGNNDPSAIAGESNPNRKNTMTTTPEDIDISGQNNPYLQPAPSNQPAQLKGSESQSNAEIRADTRSNDSSDARSRTRSGPLSVRIQNWIASPAFVTAAFWIWIAGMVVTACIKIVDYRNFIRYTSASSKPVTDSRILALFDDKLMEQHIRSNVVLEQNRLISAPMLTGIVKPRILLPEHLPEQISDFNQLAYILQHELCHLKRSDILYKWVLQMVHCIHWFNPLLLLASHTINQLCELSCDEMLLASLDEEGRWQYGNVLLDMAEYGNGYKDRVLSMTLVEEKKDLKERLANIMNYRKHARLAVAASVLVLVLVGAAGLWFGTGNYQQTKRTQKITASSGETPLQEVDLLKNTNQTEDNIPASNDNHNNSTKTSSDNALIDKLEADRDKDKANLDANQVYNDDKLLAGDDCTFNFISNYYSSNKGKLTIRKFRMTGSHTLLIVNAKAKTNLTLDCSYQLQSGKFKLVSIDPDQKVTTIHANQGSLVQVPIYPGRNVIKMAAQKCVVTSLKLKFGGLQSSAVTSVYYSEMQEKAALISAAVKQGKPVSFERFRDIVPFLSSKIVDEFIANTIAQKNHLTMEQLQDLCPFASSKGLAECLKIIVQRPDSVEIKQLQNIAPFISSKDLGEALTSLMKVKKVDVGVIVDLAPFLDSDIIGVYLRDYCDVADNKLDSFLVNIAPFAGSDDLSACMARAAKSKGLKQHTLVDLAPFAGSEGLYQYFSSRASLTQKDIDTIADLSISFMNRDDIQVLYNKAKKQSKELDLAQLKEVL